jgi:4-amino-4-deoxy-L-arabinose transferase-like glycosyltransferase
VLTGLVVRGLLALVYNGPTTSDPDTNSYTAMSANLFRLGPGDYIGLRTPGYPAIIRVLGSNLELVWALQAVLGVAACLIVYWLVVTRTGRVGLAVATASVLTVSLDVLFFETEILTEGVVLFLLTASIAVFARLLRPGGRAPWAVLLGVLTACAALTRPESVLLIVGWPLAYFLARDGSPLSRGVSRQPRGERRRARIRSGLGLLVATALPGALAVGVWASVNDALVGQFTTSTLTGLNLVDHLGSSVADAPARYAAVRDVYVAGRNRSIADGQGDANVSYKVLAAMEKASGKSFVPLSEELTSMSVNVIVHHPTDYLEISAKSWARSWDAPIYWDTSLLHPSPVSIVVQDVWKVERPLRVTLDISFLVLSVSMLLPRFRRSASPAKRLAAACAGIVVVMSVPQALLANGENGRYLHPYLPLMLVALALGLHVWRGSLAGRGQRAQRASASRPAGRPST